MIDLLRICAFNAEYAHTIDSDALERWPDLFVEHCLYRITNQENEQQGLPAGLVYANSRAMLQDRVAALREANIYERQRYRHLLGIPRLHAWQASSDQSGETSASTPFMVARIMAGGETLLFATGEYRDRFVQHDNHLLLAERIVVCDSTVTDTLLALPL